MITRILTLVLGAALLAAPLAVAKDDDGPSRLVVIGDDGEQATVTIDGNRLHLVAVDDGDVSVHEFDFSHLGELIDGAVAAAMSNLDEVLDEELTIEVDDDHMLHVSHGEQACSVNMSVLAQELTNTLANVQVQLGREFDHARGVHHRHEQGDTAELKAELERLKAELDGLREELKREY